MIDCIERIAVRTVYKVIATHHPFADFHHGDTHHDDLECRPKCRTDDLD